MRLALVTAISAFRLDEDLVPLQAALHAAGIEAPIVAWDDGTVSWRRFDAVLLRSPWDYTQRLPEFLAWAERTSAQSMLLNPRDVIRDNTDKHYLGALAARGIAVVPSAYVEPGADAGQALRDFLSTHADANDIVVKPCVGAGSRDAQRHARSAVAAAQAHAERLLAQGRSVLLQRDAASTRALFAPEAITARTPGEDELALAQAVLSTLPGAPLAYARVDLIRAADGRPCLLELELTEPSLFFAQAPGAVDRFVAVLARRIGAPIGAAHADTAEHPGQGGA